MELYRKSTCQRESSAPTALRPDTNHLSPLSLICPAIKWDENLRGPSGSDICVWRGNRGQEEELSTWNLQNKTGRTVLPCQTPRAPAQNAMREDSRKLSARPRVCQGRLAAYVSPTSPSSPGSSLSGTEAPSLLWHRHLQHVFQGHQGMGRMRWRIMQRIF